MFISLFSPKNLKKPLSVQYFNNLHNAYSVLLFFGFEDALIIMNSREGFTYWLGGKPESIRRTVYFSFLFLVFILIGGIIGVGSLTRVRLTTIVLAIFATESN